MTKKDARKERGREGSRPVTRGTSIDVLASQRGGSEAPVADRSPQPGSWLARGARIREARLLLSSAVQGSTVQRLLAELQEDGLLPRVLVEQWYRDHTISEAKKATLARVLAALPAEGANTRAAPLRVGQVWIPLLFDPADGDVQPVPLVVPQRLTCTIDTSERAQRFDSSVKAWGERLDAVAKAVHEHLISNPRSGFYVARAHPSWWRQTTFSAGPSFAEEYSGRDSRDRSFELGAAIALLAEAFDMGVPINDVATGLVSGTGEIHPLGAEIEETDVEGRENSIRRKCLGLTAEVPSVNKFVVAAEDATIARRIFLERGEDVNVVGLKRLEDLRFLFPDVTARRFRGRKSHSNSTITRVVTRILSLGLQGPREFHRSAQNQERARFLMQRLAGDIVGAMILLVCALVIGAMPMDGPPQRILVWYAVGAAWSVFGIVFFLFVYAAYAIATLLTFRALESAEALKDVLLRLNDPGRRFDRGFLYSLIPPCFIGVVLFGYMLWDQAVWHYFQGHFFHVDGFGFLLCTLAWIFIAWFEGRRRWFDSMCDAKNRPVLVGLYRRELERKARLRRQIHGGIDESKEVLSVVEAGSRILEKVAVRYRGDSPTMPSWLQNIHTWTSMIGLVWVRLWQKFTESPASLLRELSAMESKWSFFDVAADYTIIHAEDYRQLCAQYEEKEQPEPSKHYQSLRAKQREGEFYEHFRELRIQHQASRGISSGLHLELALGTIRMGVFGMLLHLLATRREFVGPIVAVALCLLSPLYLFGILSRLEHRLFIVYWLRRAAILFVAYHAMLMVLSKGQGSNLIRSIAAAYGQLPPAAKSLLFWSPAIAVIMILVVSAKWLRLYMNDHTNIARLIRAVPSPASVAKPTL